MAESLHGIGCLIEIGTVASEMAPLMEERHLTLQDLRIGIGPIHVVAQLISVQQEDTLSLLTLPGRLLGSLHGLNQTKPKEA